MSDSPTNARKAFGDVAPALAEYTDVVLFGDVWKRPGLSSRDRSLITVATLVALDRTNELPFQAFLLNEATMTWSAVRDDGFSFVSNPSTTSAFAQLGQMRNGMFFGGS